MKFKLLGNHLLRQKQGQNYGRRKKYQDQLFKRKYFTHKKCDITHQKFEENSEEKTWLLHLLTISQTISERKTSLKKRRILT